MRPPAVGTYVAILLAGAALPTLASQPPSGGASSTEVGVVRYDRGILDEEYVLAAGSITRRFVLHELPPLDGGGLVLEGGVRCDGSFRTADQGWEWRGERGLVWLGPVTVVDADAAVLPATFEVTAGTTRLVVEGAALASAAYPVAVELDLRSHELRISDMGGTGDPEHTAVYTSVASNSGNNQYLVAWQGDDNTGGLVDEEYEIFGKMLGILPFEDGFESGDTGVWSTTVP